MVGCVLVCACLRCIPILRCRRVVVVVGHPVVDVSWVDVLDVVGCMVLVEVEVLVAWLWVQLLRLLSVVSESVVVVHCDFVVVTWGVRIVLGR